MEIIDADQFWCPVICKLEDELPFFASDLPLTPHPHPPYSIKHMLHVLTVQTMAKANHNFLIRRAGPF